MIERQLSAMFHSLLICWIFQSQSTVESPLIKKRSRQRAARQANRGTRRRQCFRGPQGSKQRRTTVSQVQRHTRQHLQQARNAVHFSRKRNGGKRASQTQVSIVVVCPSLADMFNGLVFVDHAAIEKQKQTLSVCMV